MSHPTNFDFGSKHMVRKKLTTLYAKRLKKQRESVASRCLNQILFLTKFSSSTPFDEKPIYFGKQMVGKSLNQVIKSPIKTLLYQRFIRHPS